MELLRYPEFIIKKTQVKTYEINVLFKLSVLTLIDKHSYITNFLLCYSVLAGFLGMKISQKLRKYLFLFQNFFTQYSIFPRKLLN